MKKDFVLSEYQKNPENISTDMVQYWENGVMITARLSQKEAKELVRNGHSFVISSQAIGCIRFDGKKFS